MPSKDVTGLVDKLKTQKGIIIEQKVVQGANHFFDGKVEPLLTSIGAYLDKRLEERPQAERGVAPNVPDGDLSGKSAIVVLGDSRLDPAELTDVARQNLSR